MAKFLSTVGTLAIYALSVAQASALPQRRAGVTPLTSAQVNSYTPYTWYAGAAGCNPQSLLTWSCGAICTANSGFKTTAAGGNGATVQHWYVGYDAKLKTVIVGHQSTATEKLVPILTNADFILDPLPATQFPGAPTGAKVHSGFLESFQDTSADVLNAVKQTLSANNVNKVVVTGWSLGAAISVLDALHIKLQIPTADVSVIGYGQPRVGNQSFANWYDQKLAGKVTFINNKEDIVPILPGRFLGYKHTSGEIHIKTDGSWVSCSGQDNEDPQCTVGEVTSIFDGNVDDHAGPYNGIFLSDSQCS